MVEIWKQILNHEGRYEVSNYGRIRSVDHSVPNKRWHKDGTRVYKSRIRAQSSTGKAGYMGVCIHDANQNYKRIIIKTHIAVLEAFVGPRPHKMDACHNDGNIKNNRLENLRWDTKKNNNKDKDRHGTAQIGSKNPSAKLTENQVKYIISRLGSDTMSSLSREFGVSVTTIWNIKRGRIWSHISSMSLTEI